jgi:hypothetical protein
MSSTFNPAHLDRNLAAFGWLIMGTNDYSKWTGTNLFNDYTVNGKQMCKVCDTWLKPGETDVHSQLHVEQDRARRDRLKAEEKAAKEEYKEFVRAENEALKPIKTDRKEKVKKMSSTVVAAAPKADHTAAVSALFDTGNVITVADLIAGTGLDVVKIRPVIKALTENGTIEIVGKVETGKRGRPALKYKKAIV